MSEHARRLALDSFFASVQVKALRQIEFAVKHREEALDILQDAMMRLAQKYSGQQSEWPMLFQRIIQNAIRDWYRRQKVRSIMSWFGSSEEIEHVVPESAEAAPDKQHAKMRSIEQALQSLPHRQQQAFILRAWWGYDTEEAAAAMACSAGSVKTHYSRALHKLRELLEHEWIAEDT
jgi:RNA polymerase sigma-70 factor (ECF subfamily)